jgi:probable HAF family extracellular repeat protein
LNFDARFTFPGDRVRGAAIFSAGKYTDICASNAATEIDCFASRLNDAGQAIGDAELTPSRAFLYDSGSIALLSPLGDDLVIHAVDINNAGQIIGTSDSPSHGRRGFLYDQGEMTEIQLSGGTDTPDLQPFSINESGVVAGTYYSQFSSQSSAYRVFRFADGATTDLGDCWNDHADRVYGDVETHSLFVGEDGQVICTGNGASDPYIILQPGGPLTAYHRATEATHRLGVNAEFLFQGHAIDRNEAGQILGKDLSYDDSQGDSGRPSDISFIYQDGRIEPLHSLNGCPPEGISINSWGQVSGWVSLKSDEVCPEIYGIATLFINGMAFDLNELLDDADPIKGVVHLGEASAINDSGQIIAFAEFTPDDRCSYYLLTLRGASEEP